MKRICVLLSGDLHRPIGGHKVIYQYLNAVASQGNEILIVNNIFRRSNHWFGYEQCRKIYSLLRYFKKVILKQNTCKSWYTLHQSIKEICVWNYSAEHMPKADFYIATNALTAPFLLDYKVSDNNKLYFIQGYENWLVGDTELIRTFHFPFKKIVIAKWLQSKLNNLGETSIYIPNGIDTHIFYETIPPEKKNKFTISILYHEMPEKKFTMGLKAVAIARKTYPEIEMIIFGAYPKPSNLPPWCKYFRTPDPTTHNNINNSAAIYLGTSSSEGFGLTVVEAMICGQAVICTDIEGYKEVAIDNDTALLTSTNDEYEMANKIIRLIENDELRIRIAHRGKETANNYSLNHSELMFCNLFA